MIILCLQEGANSFDSGLFYQTINDKVKAICKTHDKGKTSSYYFCNVMTLLAFEVYCKQYGIDLKVWDGEFNTVTKLEEIYAIFAEPFLKLDALKLEFDD